MLEFISGSFVTTSAGILLFLYFYKHPEKFEKWLSILFTILSFITKKYKRHQIKYDIQSSINRFVTRLSQDTNVSENQVKIKWAGRAEDDEVNWDDDGVVLILQDRGQRNRNFVHAAYLFTSTSLLRNTKTHLSKKQSTAIDLFTTGKIIEEENPPALDYFIQGIANPLLNDENIKELVEQFEDMDKSGYYTHILFART